MRNPLASSDGTVRAVWSGTGLFVVTAGLAAAVSAGPVRAVAVAVAVAAFLGGCALYLAGYAGAVRRSRSEEISMAALTFLAGDTAPAQVRRSLLAATAVQVVAAVATASVRPFTSLAFGILAPVLGLGAQAYWAARFGSFPRRPPPVRRSGRDGAGRPTAGSPAKPPRRTRSARRR